MLHLTCNGYHKKKKKKKSCSEGANRILQLSNFTKSSLVPLRRANRKDWQSYRQQAEKNRRDLCESWLNDVWPTIHLIQSRYIVSFYCSLDKIKSNSYILLEVRGALSSHHSMSNCKVINVNFM